MWISPIFRDFCSTSVNFLCLIEAVVNQVNFFLQERLLKGLLLFLSLLSLNTTLTSSVNTSSKRSPCLSETSHLNPDSLVWHCSAIYVWERMTFIWQIWYCVTSLQHLNVLYEATQCTSIITWGFVRMLTPKSWKIEFFFSKTNKHKFSNSI